MVMRQKRQVVMPVMAAAAVVAALVLWVGVAVSEVAAVVQPMET